MVDINKLQDKYNARLKVKEKKHKMPAIYLGPIKDESERGYEDVRWSKLKRTARKSRRNIHKSDNWRVK